MKQLIIIVFKLPRAGKEKANLLNKYMSENFSNIEGYTVRVIVVPTNNIEIDVGCIFPKDLDENTLEILNNIKTQIDSWEEKH